MKDYNYLNVFEMPRPHSARNLTTVQSIYTDMTKEPKYIYSKKFELRFDPVLTEKLGSLYLKNTVHHEYRLRV